MSTERTTDEASAFFVEPEQLAELRAINKACMATVLRSPRIVAAIWPTPSTC